MAPPPPNSGPTVLPPQAALISAARLRFAWPRLHTSATFLALAEFLINTGGRSEARSVAIVTSRRPVRPAADCAQAQQPKFGHHETAAGQVAASPTTGPAIHRMGVCSRAHVCITSKGSVVTNLTGVRAWPRVQSYDEFTVAALVARRGWLTVSGGTCICSAVPDDGDGCIVRIARYPVL